MQVTGTNPAFNQHSNQLAAAQEQQQAQSLTNGVVTSEAIGCQCHLQAGHEIINTQGQGEVLGHLQQ
jgi:hypothetical protein